MSKIKLVKRSYYIRAFKGVKFTNGKSKMRVTGLALSKTDVFVIRKVFDCYRIDHIPSGYTAGLDNYSLTKAIMKINKFHEINVDWKKTTLKAIFRNKDELKEKAKQIALL